MSAITASPLHHQHGAVRLTRRGRLAVFTLALLVVLAVGFVLASGAVGTGEPGTPEPTRVVVVGSGDTLWEIAAGLADDGDVRAMVAKIQKLNALDSGMLTAGQKLVVPIGG
ncbi:LysM peptidoglycan-binding domain-containing protein [Nocardioides aquiterrae]|uniref:LysM domain-containing protein n=1 Tax=Nocardioides aquiterrae TaxID=203799 RepID=A0ABN1UD19_9ACTN